MSEKVYVRKCEKYTIWESSTPLEVDVEKLKRCDPPYEGESHEDLLNYLSENVFNNYDWADNETNKEVYGEDEAYDLTMDDSPEMDVYSDSREKSADDWIEIGVPNEEYRKTGRFETFADNMPRNDW